MEQRTTTSVLLVLAFFLMGTSISAQLFIPKDPDGEKASDAWTYLPNQGQNFDLSGQFRSDVKFSSVGTFPTLFLMKENRIGIVIPDVDVANPSNSTISRLDLKFTGGNGSVEPHLYEPTNQRFNFFETYTPQGVTGVTGGKRVIYENVYPLH